VIERLGKKPDTLKAVAYAQRPEGAGVAAHVSASATTDTELKGIDVFVHWPKRNPGALAEAVGKLAVDGLKLQMIDNRGVKVWPAGRAETFCTDSFRCRFIAQGPIDMCKLLEVAKRIAGAGIDVAVTETLRNFDGKAGFTLAQGQ